MGRKIALLVAGFVFSIIALIQLLRLLLKLEVTVGGEIIPFSVNLSLFFCFIVLAIWMVIASRY